MAKVTINGEVFPWNASEKPMSEALAIEKELKCRYVDWETDLAAGSARALAGWVWLVWRRNGRDVPLADILSGQVEIDLDGLSIGPDEGEGEGEGEADPTASPAAKGASGTTGASTRGSSPRSSESARGRSSS